MAEKDSPYQAGWVGVLAIVVVAAVLVLAGTFLFVKYRSSLPVSPSSSDLTSTSSTPVSSESAQTSLLDTQPFPLPTPQGSIGQTTPTLTSLQQQIDNLQNQINSLKASLPQLSSVSNASVASAKAPVYIPIGSTPDSFGDQSWKSIDALAVNIDPTDYPGYSSMQLEVIMRSNQGAGTISARLFNVTGNSPVSNSSVSGSTASFTLFSSGTFNLSGGKNLYKVQVMSTVGDSLFVQNARIRVNF